MSSDKRVSQWLFEPTDRPRLTLTGTVLSLPVKICVITLIVSRSKRLNPMKKELRTLLAAAVFVVAGAVTAQAADIAPVTGHWTKLGPTVPRWSIT
jgi:hypothetical protein